MYREGVVYRKYCPGPSQNIITVPEKLRPQLLKRCHDAPGAGHLGSLKTKLRVRQMGYWVNLAEDVEQYCVVCQQSKKPMPSYVVAVDILEVPRSYLNNRYLLVVQDYFTMWADAIPLPDQTAQTITHELIKIFAYFGMPQILHSDQGRNFADSNLASIWHKKNLHHSVPSSRRWHG